MKKIFALLGLIVVLFLPDFARAAVYDFDEKIFIDRLNQVGVDMDLNFEIESYRTGDFGEKICDLSFNGRKDGRLSLYLNSARTIDCIELYLTSGDRPENGVIFGCVLRTLGLSEQEFMDFSDKLLEDFNAAGRENLSQTYDINCAKADKIFSASVDISESITTCRIK